MKQRIHALLEGIHRGDRLGETIHGTVLALIVGNIVAVIAESIYPLGIRYRWALLWFERLSILLFTVEYVLRVWSCTADPRFSSPVKGRLRFGCTPLALIDLLAIAPFYLPFTVPDLRVIRAMRLFRHDARAEVRSILRSLPGSGVGNSAETRRTGCLLHSDGRSRDYGIHIDVRG